MGKDRRLLKEIMNFSYSFYQGDPEKSTTYAQAFNVPKEKAIHLQQE